jgi:Holliday junction resolvase
MGKKGSSYERELKGILAGDEKVISKFKGLSSEEAKWYRSTMKRPFMVVRAAGSLGVDLIAIRDDFSFPIEVKSSSDTTIRFTQSSSRAQIQAQTFSLECSRANIVGIYAFRLKGFRGDPWRIFALPSENLRGRMKLLYDFLPKLPITQAGNFVLKWEQGMPLSKFLSYLNYEENKEDSVEN